MKEERFARDLAKVLARLAREGTPVTLADLQRPRGREPRTPRRKAAKTPRTSHPRAAQ